MKCRRVIWSALLVAAFMIAAGVGFVLNHGPTYEGKTLGYWLDQLPSVDFGKDGRSESIALPGDSFLSSEAGIADQALRGKVRKRAYKALDTIGTNALPELIPRLQAKDSRLKVAVEKWGESLRVRGCGYYRLAAFRRGQALAAFQYLRTRARPAVPELLNLTMHQDTNIQFSAWFALEAAAPDEFHKRKHPPIIEHDYGRQ